MKERPILFSGEMVRAILDGRKSQTRRVVKPQPPDHHEPPHQLGDGVWVTTDNQPPDILKNYPMRCPYGAPGDRLYVREAFRHYGNMYTMGQQWGCVTFRADDKHLRMPAETLPNYGPSGHDGWKRWRPSIHMPRWASRILLEVTGVRVDRLHQINAGDAVREGHPDGMPTFAPDDDGHDRLHWFMDLWDSINGKRPGCAWDDDPWLWVVEFRRVET